MRLPGIAHLLSLTTMGMLLVACGVSQKVQVPTSAPFASCEINTYGWSRLLGLEQEIEVSVIPNVDLSRVVDLSVFGALKPCMNDREVRRILGEPHSEQVDRWGETWIFYDYPAATLKVGCEYQSSGSTTTSGCQWRLSAIMKTGHDTELFHPELVRFMTLAKAVPETVQARTLHVRTSDYEESASYSFDGSHRLSWHSRGEGCWRPGEPKREN